MNVSRRKALRIAAAGSAWLAAPLALRRADALATSGSVRVFAWPDYIQKNQIERFEADTGITVALTTYGSNEEAERKLREAGGRGFDVIFPSVTNGTHYYADSLLQPLDESRIGNIGNIITTMLRDSVALGATHAAKRMLLPFSWGTEAITFDSSRMPIEDGEVSFGSIWSDAARGKAIARQKSAIMGVGLYLEAQGELKSNRMLDVYKSEAEARRVWDVCAKFIIARKGNIVALWNDAAEAANAFKQTSAAIGQTWDTTGLLLNREDAKWKYRMPKEGGITWMDAVGLPAGAENVEQAYAFINALLTPEMGGMFAQNTGYNAAIQGAADFAGDIYKRQFGEVYNADNLANLWWWQAETPWFAPLGLEYAERIAKA